MLKLYFKLKKYLSNQGFTLVELLSVIVILAIIMLIAIPAVLNTLEIARKKTFLEYVDKVVNISQKKYAEEQMLGTKSSTSCYIYNINTDLDINNTGEYEGWILINPINNDIYVSMNDNNYVLIAYHYNNTEQNINNFLLNKTNENKEKIKIEELTKYVSQCSVYDSNGNIIQDITKKAKIIDGPTFNKTIKLLAGGEESPYPWWNKDTNIKYFKKSNSLANNTPTSKVSTDDSEYDVIMWFDTDTIYYYYTEANIFELNKDSSYMFAKLESLTSIDTFKFDTSNVENIGYMFSECKSIIKLDCSTWNVSKVTDHRYFAEYTENMKSLDLSNWNLESVPDEIFRYNCKYLFSNSNSLEYVSLRNWNIPLAIDLSSQFSNLGYGQSRFELDLSNWNIPNVTTVAYMFSSFHNIRKLNISGWNAHNIVKFDGMFRYMDNLTELIGYEDLDVSKAESLYEMFTKTGLQELNLSKWNIKNVKKLDNMFYLADKLVTIDLSSWDTSNITSMYFTFYGCVNLENIYVGDKWNVENVTNSYMMFYQCFKINNYEYDYIDKTKAYVGAGGYLSSNI